MQYQFDNLTTPGQQLLCCPLITLAVIRWNQEESNNRHQKHLLSNIFLWLRRRQAIQGY